MKKKESDMAKHKKNTIPEKFRTLNEAAEFWNRHDLDDYWGLSKPSKFEIKVSEYPRYVAVETNIARKLAQIARRRKISPETLVNLWLAERLSKVA